MWRKDRSVTRSESSMSWPFTKRRDTLSINCHSKQGNKNDGASKDENRRCRSGPNYQIYNGK